MTRIQLVDENDILIGHASRSEVDFKKIICRITALWITNSDGQVLIAQRSLSKDKDPGVWGPAAAGTLDEGETYESNAYKEAEEEIGVVDEKFELGPKVSQFSQQKFFCQWYYFITDRKIEDFTLQADEVAQIAWIDLAELQADVRQNPSKYVPSMQFNLDTHK